ncbi:hypothetical protein ACFQ5J_12410 [Lacticaseibacillus baoqingensis]|uniref:Flavin reductase n=1 Tax=Lacticaseibacillus baoqingensis TaxID=2486013 RepID=A0ABW4EBF7_9LACO|nr:hypothetical protein [Lacticaseibacillus baoqingensis]
MLVSYPTRHMYFNYPIFIIGYQDERFGYNVTTCSSGYSLGGMYCFGLSSDTNAAMQLLTYRQGTINFLDRTHLDMVEFAGSHPGTAKLTDPRFAHDKINGLPVLTAAFAALLLKIDATQVYQGYVNFTAHITERLVDDAALAGGQFDAEAIVPVGFAGDRGSKVYRVPGEILTPGNFS